MWMLHLSKNNPYDSAKIAHHPDALRKLRDGESQSPIFIQWFPTNFCEQACRHCAYGHWKDDSQGSPAEMWKNHQLFDERTYMPRDKMIETIDCLSAMGTKAIEITGGGEPTIYPFFDEMVERIAAMGLEVALVSNGVRITEDRARLVMQDARASWARISLDAGTRESYVRTRNAPSDHFDKAAEAIASLVSYKTHPEANVGVGYVVDTDNWDSVYDGIMLSADYGADSVRVSIAFTPEGKTRWKEECIFEADRQVKAAAAELETKKPDFAVFNLIMERWNNVALDHQNYPYCYWKEIGCVIGADSNIYSCCSLAYNKLGLIGSIQDRSFQQLWFGNEASSWRRRHRPHYDCPVFCLYERRNRNALCLIAESTYEDAAQMFPMPLHVNFV
jgi:MoaA/NifB/PqqE/SkfB family radical SAM enzyme